MSESIRRAAFLSDVTPGMRFQYTSDKGPPWLVIDRLLAQVAEALRIIADLSDARVADADHWPVPPEKWVALQEARENWEAN